MTDSWCVWRAANTYARETQELMSVLLCKQKFITTSFTTTAAPFVHSFTLLQLIVQRGLVSEWEGRGEGTSAPLDYSIRDMQTADLYISSPWEFTIFINDLLLQQ